MIRHTNRNKKTLQKLETHVQQASNGKFILNFDDRGIGIKTEQFGDISIFSMKGIS